MEIKPIAYFRSPFPGKFGIPRQAGLAPALRGRIVFEPEYRSADALRGLEGFDYLWLIWEFSGNRPTSARLAEAHPPGDLERSDVGISRPAGAGLCECKVVEPERPQGVWGQHSPQLETVAWKATVRPPRLGGNRRVGVFASRSPFRPNPLGLSSVRLESIDYEAKGPDGKPIGPVINVLGADLMDGTPIYDIKPYIEYADSHPGARSGFVDAEGWEPLEVEIPEGLVPDGMDRESLAQVLSLDPRPRYHDDPRKVYGMAFGGRDVRFSVDGKTLKVISIT